MSLCNAISASIMSLQVGLPTDSSLRRTLLLPKGPTEFASCQRICSCACCCHGHSQLEQLDTAGHRWGLAVLVKLHELLVTQGSAATLQGKENGGLMIASLDPDELKQQTHSYQLPANSTNQHKPN